MMNFLQDFAISTSFKGNVEMFWASPVGLISIVIILISSMLAVFKEKPDFTCSIYNWVLIIICSIALLHIHEGTDPKRQMLVIVVALAIKKAWNIFRMFKQRRKCNGC